MLSQSTFTSVFNPVDAKGESSGGPYMNFVNGKFVSENLSAISIKDLGYIRGFGIFDYLQSYQGRLLHLDDHLLRLQASAKMSQIEMPIPLEEIRELVLEVVKINPKILAGIRIVVTAGNHGPDLILPEGKANISIIFHPLKPSPERFYSCGLKASFTKHLRFLPQVKSTHYMPAILALKDAKSRGFDDAIYVTESSEILEATTSNLFFLKDGVWITDDSNRILHGITRKNLLSLMKDSYKLQFRALKVEELKSCDEAFICSSAKEVMPLVQIENQLIGSGMPGPETIFLRDLYKKHVQESLL